jgi:hypothetical protein
MGVRGKRGSFPQAEIRGADGTAVTVPVGTSEEDLQRLIELARSLDAPRIHVR